MKVTNKQYENELGHLIYIPHCLGSWKLLNKNPSIPCKKNYRRGEASMDIFQKCTFSAVA